MRHRHIAGAAVTLLLMLSASACAASASPPAIPPQGGPDPTEAPSPPEETQAIAEPTIDFSSALEDFKPEDFGRPTHIDNAWFPLRPGSQFVFEGVTEESGVQVAHRVIFTVTDLTKAIDGVRTLVVWDQDFSQGELVETELAFFAQDDDGNVWHFGQYPEVYERGRLVEAPAWISGLKGATAGISMKATPQLGAPSYSQGWGPAVNWTDRAQVSEIDAQTCVPVGCYEDVLVIEEFSQEEAGAFQLKYYARGLGNIRVGWKGLDATRETLELIEVILLDSEAVAQVRAAALELESRAYEISKEVYDQTQPAQQLPALE